MRKLIYPILAFTSMVTLWYGVNTFFEISSIIKEIFISISVVNINESFKSVCPGIPPNSKGRIELRENVTVQEAEMKVKGVRKGGKWWPTHCQAIWNVAIIAPFKNRLFQLGQFLNHMHHFLQHQQLNYSIYIVEQDGDEIFNKARVMNAGFMEAIKDGPWDCYVFHDIDMLPVDDRNLYHCSFQIRHLVVAASTYGYRLPYPTYFGGASIWTEDQVREVNGWSNKFWGWGAEDDEMYHRVVDTGTLIFRYSREIGRYEMIKHVKSERNPERDKIAVANRGHYMEDGLNNFKYVVTNYKRHTLFTHILVDIGSKNS